MKRTTLLSLALLLFAFASKAQITKGSTYLGGSIGFNQTKHESQINQENSGTNLGLSLQFGKAVAENRIFGVYANGSHSHTKNTGPGVDGRFTSNDHGGGVFYRRYFNLSSKWYLFGNGSFGYYSGNNENKINGAKTGSDKTWGLSVGITPGISFAAGKRIHIESSFANLLGFSYGHSTLKSYSGTLVNTTKSSQWSGTANLSGFNNINFGLRWILPG